MAKSPRKTYDLADVIKREMEKRAAFEVRIDGEHTLVVPPPILWPDKALRADMYADASMRLIVGPNQQEAYDAFEASGGTGKLLLQIVTEHYGAELPES